MSDEQAWSFPDAVQPRSAQFDLERAYDSVVLVRAEIPEDAYSARTLGTERGGYGAVIREDGLILTIGYLINEASQIWLTTNKGAVVEGYPIAYDQATGFGLIQPLGKLSVPHFERGLAADLKPGDSAFVIGHGGRAHSLRTKIIAKHEFAGPWEYVLDEAIFTSPAHPQWGGSALLDAQGNLVGTGSLLVQREMNGEVYPVNMFVPTDLLGPILDGMLKTGRSPHPPRPWLGMRTEDPGDRLIVDRISPDGPASRAGIKVGDQVLAVSGANVQGLLGFFRAVWSLGPAGVDVPLTLSRSGDVLRITVKSADRADYQRKPKLH